MRLDNTFRSAMPPAPTLNPPVLSLMFCRRSSSLALVAISCSKDRAVVWALVLAVFNPAAAVLAARPVPVRAVTSCWVCCVKLLTWEAVAPLPTLPRALLSWASAFMTRWTKRCNCASADAVSTLNVARKSCSGISTSPNYSRSQSSSEIEPSSFLFLSFSNGLWSSIHFSHFLGECHIDLGGLCSSE